MWDFRTVHAGHALAGALAAALLAAGCGKHQSAPAPLSPSTTLQPETARSSTDQSAGARFFDPKENPGAVVGVPLDPHTLTPSQLQYGIAPRRDPRVTYAPDVILMEEGDKAIRMAASDGMTWVFDASAPHVNELQEGKIVFATGRAVGRIGQITRAGGTVTVKLAPVQITEVIHQGHFLIDSNFNPQDLIAYTAPDFPSVLDLSVPPSAKPTTAWSAADAIPQVVRTLFAPVAGAAPPSPATVANAAAAASGTLKSAPAPSIGNPQPFNLNDAFKVYPLAGSDGSLGLEFDYNAKGLFVKSEGRLRLGQAKVRFVLDIEDAAIKKFGMDLSGAAAMTFEFTSSAAKEGFVNAHQLGELPMDLTLPIPIAGVPLALTVHTKFVLNTGFSAKTSTLSANAKYTLTGELFIGWDGGPAVEPSLKPKAETDFGNTADGVSVGINSMALDFMVQPMVGIGAFGFNTGIYVGLEFGGSVVKQSSIALTACKAGYMNGKVFSGVGYQLAGPFVAVVNTVLSAFTKYRIDQSGTLIKGPEATILDESTQAPPGCASAAKT
jgi:hypothetical protein